MISRGFRGPHQKSSVGWQGFQGNRMIKLLELLLGDGGLSWLSVLELNIF